MSQLNFINAMALYSGIYRSLIHVQKAHKLLAVIDPQVDRKGSFAAVLAVTDVNADGVNDLAIGLPQATVEQVQVNNKVKKLKQAGGVILISGDSF